MLSTHREDFGRTVFTRYNLVAILRYVLESVPIGPTLETNASTLQQLL